MLTITRALPILLVLLSADLLAGQISPSAKFAWDDINPPGTITGFNLSCCPPAGCETLPIPFPTARQTTMTLKTTSPGDARCTIAACDGASCSGQSNAVMWDRTAPEAPESIRFSR